MVEVIWNAAHTRGVMLGVAKDMCSTVQKYTQKLDAGDVVVRPR